MTLSPAQLRLMEKLKAGDVLSGKPGISDAWRFSIVRDGKEIPLSRRLRYATVEAMAVKGALMRTDSYHAYWGAWQPTTAGLAAYRAEVGG